MTGNEVPIEKTKFNAVMFDLDGTLLDTINGIMEMINFALETMGYPKHNRETYKKIVGAGIEFLVRDALPEKERNEATIKKCLSIVLSNYSNYYNNNTLIYPGISELLLKLKDMNYKLVVLSNRPDKYTRQLVKEHFPVHFFDHVSGAKPEFPNKPDPSVALSIIRDLKLDPSNFLYLGDTDVDMKTAINAGMFPVGVLWGFRNKEELLSNGAKIILEHPEELIKFLCN